MALEKPADLQSIQQQSLSNTLANLDIMEQQILTMIERMRSDILTLSDQLAQS